MPSDARLAQSRSRPSGGTRRPESRSRIRLEARAVARVDLGFGRLQPPARACGSAAAQLPELAAIVLRRTARWQGRWRETRRLAAFCSRCQALRCFLVMHPCFRRRAASSGNSGDDDLATILAPCNRQPITDPHAAGGLRTLAVHLDLAARDGLLRLAATAEKTRAPEPFVDPERVCRIGRRVVAGHEPPPPAILASGGRRDRCYTRRIPIGGRHAQ